MHAPLTRPARAHAAPSPTLAPARPFAPQPRAADAGPAAHDLGRVSVAPAEAPIQRVKHHHNPAKKKYLAKGVGKQQVATSAAALAIKKAAPQGQPISNREAARLARAAQRQNG